MSGILSGEEIMSWILSANLNRVIENKSNLPDAGDTQQI